MKTRPLLWRALVAYLVFVAASYLEYLLGSEFLLPFWPHIAGLAVGRTTEMEVVLLQAIGLLLVLASGIVISSNWPSLTSWRAAAVSVAATLGISTLTLCGIALALGWPMAV